MSTPAGWYDDGSGRQRWWDGSRWTEHYAPGAAPDAPTAVIADATPSASSATPVDVSATPTEASASPWATPATKSGPSVLGIIALAAAVVGTILACIPGIAVAGWILLPAAFVLAIVGFFVKGAKWAPVTALVVSIVGTIIGFIVFFISLAAIAGNVLEELEESLQPLPSASALDEDADDATGGDGEDAPEHVDGESVAVEQMMGAAAITVVSATYGPDNGSGLPLSPDHGGYLILDVQWEGLEGTTVANPLYFSAIDANGTEGDLDLLGVDLLMGENVGAGKIVRGNLSFDIPDTGSYTIVFKNELLQEVARTTVEATQR